MSREIVSRILDRVLGKGPGPHSIMVIMALNSNLGRWKIRPIGEAHRWTSVNWANPWTMLSFNLNIPRSLTGFRSVDIWKASGLTPCWPTRGMMRMSWSLGSADKRRGGDPTTIEPNGPS